jgi:hypothetical protein
MSLRERTRPGVASSSFLILGGISPPVFQLRVLGRELFWGDDRLEDAISWYRFGSVRFLTGWLEFPEPDSLGG